MAQLNKKGAKGAKEHTVQHLGSEGDGKDTEEIRALIFKAWVEEEQVQ
jgi:hypothetical protein